MSQQDHNKRKRDDFELCHDGAWQIGDFGTLGMSAFPEGCLF